MASTQHQARRAPTTWMDERPLVLVAHSSPTARQTLLVTLDLLGFDVIVTDGDVEPLLWLDDLRPQVVVVESTMWSASGDVFVDRLRPPPDAEHVNVVVFGDLPVAFQQPVEAGVILVHHVGRQHGVSGLLVLINQLASVDRAPRADLGSSRLS